MTNAELIEKMALHPNGLMGLISNNFFKNTMKYPNRNDYKFKTTCEHCGTKIENENAEKEFKDAMIAYRLEDGRLHALFKFAAMYDYGLDGLKPEVYSKAFSMAWERGHSAGLHEVYNCLADIADLLILTIEKR